MNRRGDGLLLGEWACLGIIERAPTHGFAVAARLAEGGDLGRVWSMSRALTYRCIDQLRERGLVRDAGEEPGRAGGPRTILAVTATGSKTLRAWLDTPVAHLRDYRSELLLKLLLHRDLGSDPTTLLSAQRALTADLVEVLQIGVHPRGYDGIPADPVTVWRREAALAALRFVEGTLASARTA